jgi:hypothetical protein
MRLRRRAYREGRSAGPTERERVLAVQVRTIWLVLQSPLTFTPQTEEEGSHFCTYVILDLTVSLHAAL